MRVQLVARVDVAERIRHVVEGHFDHAQAAVPGVDFASARGEVVTQVGVQTALAKAEHGVSLVAGAGDRELGFGLQERCVQALGIQPAQSLRQE